MFSLYSSSTTMYTDVQCVTFIYLFIHWMMHFIFIYPFVFRHFIHQLALPFHRGFSVAFCGTDVSEKTDSSVSGIWHLQSFRWMNGKQLNSHSLFVKIQITAMQSLKTIIKTNLVWTNDKQLTLSLIHNSGHDYYYEWACERFRKPLSTL